MKKIIPLAGADKVAFLRGRADAAVEMLDDALSALCENNSAIQSTITENAAVIRDLEDCNRELHLMAEHNTNIINNFNRLLNGDTETTN